MVYWNNLLEYMIISISQKKKKELCAQLMPKVYLKKITHLNNPLLMVFKSI